MVDQNRQHELYAAMELLHFAFRRITHEPDQRLAALGLARAHHRVLYFVGRHPECSVGELVATLRISKQALNAPLRRLVAGGWIEAAHGPGDRRIKQLRLSQSGAALEAELSGDQCARFERVFRAAGRAAEQSWSEVMAGIAAP